MTVLPRALIESRPALVFDLWNTLAFNDQSENPFDALVRSFGLDPDLPEERARVERPLMTRRFDTLDRALDHLESLLERAAGDRSRLRALWEEARVSARLYDDVTPAIDALADRFPLALLSNTQSFGMDELLANRPFGRFAARVLSFEHGLAKPDPAFFGLVASALRIPAGRLVMIGDSVDRDLEPARAARYGATIWLDRDGSSAGGSRPRAAAAVVRDLWELANALSLG